MSTTRKIAIGLGLAGGALLAAYLLSGERKQRTKELLTKAGRKIKDALDPKDIAVADEPDVNYV